jgi:hypothetical protein
MATLSTASYDSKKVLHLMSHERTAVGCCLALHLVRQILAMLQEPADSKAMVGANVGNGSSLKPTPARSVQHMYKPTYHSKRFLKEGNCSRTVSSSTRHAYSGIKPTIERTASGATGSRQRNVKKELRRSQGRRVLKLYGVHAEARTA